MPTRLFLLLLKTNRATLLFKSPRDDLQRKIRGEILFFFFFHSSNKRHNEFHSESFHPEPRLGGSFWTRNFGRRTVAGIHPE